MVAGGVGCVCVCGGGGGFNLANCVIGVVASSSYLTADAVVLSQDIIASGPEHRQLQSIIMLS